MKKDTITSVRINSEIKKRLERDGLTIQKVLDAAIGKLYKIKRIIQKK